MKEKQIVTPFRSDDHQHSTCLASILTAAEQFCRQRGLKLTPLRYRVLELVWKTHEPVKAYDILQILQSEKKGAAPPTVYRALDFLIEEGLVHKIDSMNAYVGCMHPDTHSDCFFMICLECGTAEECCNDDLAASIMKATRQYRFTPRTTTLEITGTCMQCRGDGG